MPDALPEPDPWTRRAVAGDRAAWRVLVERHGPMVWGLCRRLAADPEDAYQAVWVKVFAAIGGFDPRGPASAATWIRTVAHRHLVDLSRRAKVRGRVVPLVEVADDGVPADEHLSRARRAERLERALARLPDAQRRVVVLHHLYGAPLEDIAREEGVPLGTVKSRLHRGRGRLLELLGGDR